MFVKRQKARCAQSCEYRRKSMFKYNFREDGHHIKR